MASRQSDRDDAAAAAERAMQRRSGRWRMRAATRRDCGRAGAHARARCAHTPSDARRRCHATRRRHGSGDQSSLPWTPACARSDRSATPASAALADQIVAAGGRCLGPDGATENGGCDATALLLCWVCAAPPPTGGYPASSVCGLPGPIDAMPPLALLEQTRFSLEPAGDTPTRAHFYYALAAGAVPVLDGGHEAYRRRRGRAILGGRRRPASTTRATIAFDGRAAVAGSSNWLASLRAAAAAPSAGRDSPRPTRCAARALFSNARGGDDAFAPSCAPCKSAPTPFAPHPDVGPAPERPPRNRTRHRPLLPVPARALYAYAECKRHELRGELVKHGIAPLFIERLQPPVAHRRPRAPRSSSSALLDWYAARPAANARWRRTSTISAARSPTRTRRPPSRGARRQLADAQPAVWVEPPRAEDGASREGVGAPARPHPLPGLCLARTADGRALHVWGRLPCQSRRLRAHRPVECAIHRLCGAARRLGARRR